MNDSMINPIFLTSSIHLQNVEKLIKNLESTTSNDERFLLESIQFPNEHLSIDSFFNDTSKTIEQTSNYLPSNSSSTSWKQMKENQRMINEIPSKEISSPLNLYKIFQRKSMNTTSYRSTIISHKIKQSSNYRQSYFHKSLPDLSFVTHYSKQIPRSLDTSPLLRSSSSSDTNIARTTPSPTLIHQHKQDSDRPRTLKSIKRYKNSKHSTEPFNMYCSSTLLSLPISSISKNISSRTHHSETDLRQCSSIQHLSDQSNKPNGIRCHTNINHVDPRCSSLAEDRPPNEFSFQNDQIIINLDEPVPLIDQSSITMNSSFDLLQRITTIIKRLFEIKRADKNIFLNNELNPQLDTLLKNELCPAIQNILEHGRKDPKKITPWKIIQISISSPIHTPSPIVYQEAKKFAQNSSSSYWLYKFQAFIFALLNKNELINWLYYFTRQKDLLQRYYQYPDALILVSISSTFNLFERIMTQLEKLTSLTFHLTYHPPSQEEFIHSTNPRDWMMTLSRKTSKTFVPIQVNDTLRSTLSRKLNAIFTKTNSTRVIQSSTTITKEQEPSIVTHQSRIPRSSLNIDKPQSVRYRAKSLSSR